MQKETNYACIVRPKKNLISNLKIFKTSKAYEKEKDHTTFVEFVIDNLP